VKLAEATEAGAREEAALEQQRAALQELQVRGLTGV
jgi:hypothetical protein